MENLLSYGLYYCIAARFNAILHFHFKITEDFNYEQ